MELRHLRYLITVADRGGFGSAARFLHVSQSAISEQIRDLELELAVPLFDRTTRSIRLTHYGEQFVRNARAVLALADKAVADVQRSVQGEIGTLTIGFFVGGTGRFLPGIIRQFRNTHKDVQVSLVEMAPVMQHRALQNGAIDIAFTRPVPNTLAPTLNSEHYLTEPMFAVMLRNHPLAKNRVLSIRQLANEQFILNDRNYSPTAFDKVITLCSEGGFSPRIGAVATVAPGVLALVEAGEGVAILPQGSRLLSSEELVFIPLSDQAASIDLVIAWSSEHERPVFHPFLELARKKRR